MILRNLKRLASIVSAVLFAAACGSLPTIEGVGTILSPKPLELRMSLRTQAVPLANAPQYSATTSCNYHFEYLRAGRLAKTLDFPLAVKPARDRLLVVLGYSAPESTALIGRHGMLHDFNYTDPLDEDRWNSENFATKTEQLRARLGPSYSFLNTMQVLFPVLSPNARSPGDLLGIIDNEHGTTFGRLHYRGMTSFAGSRAALADLHVESSTAPGRPINYGFFLFEERTYAPLLIVMMDTPDSYLQLRRAGCPQPHS